MGRPLLFFAVSFALSFSAGLSWAAPDQKFDQGVDHKPVLEAAVSAAGSPLPAAARARAKGDDVPVWISVADKDVSVLGSAFGLPDRPVILQGAGVSVYQARTVELDELSEAMHQKLHKCGGFFAHSTLEEAKADLEPAPAVTARAFTIDQGAIVPSMVALADEPSITKTITRLASFKNRYYRSKTGT